MLNKYNKYRVLKVFLYSPLEDFRLRELARLSKISPPSVMNYLKELEKEEFIIFQNRRGIPFYKANFDGEKFREFKKISILFEVNNCGLIEFLWDKLSPEAIILYGSYARGEATEKSDLDLFIVGKENDIDISKYEKYLGMNIHLMFNKYPENISVELKNNIINGIVLKGYLKIFK